MGRLTYLAELRARSNYIYSYIIEVRPEKLDEMFEYIKKLDVYEQVLKRGNFFGNSGSPFVGPPEKIPEASYIVATLKRDDVFALAEHPDVIRIYSNEIIRVHQFPTVPRAGVWTFFWSCAC